MNGDFGGCRGGRGYGLPQPVTGAEEIRVSFRDQSADWSWESVIPLHKSKGERIATASVRTGFAMTGSFTGGAVRRAVGDAGPYGGDKGCGRRADVGIGPYGYIIVSAAEVRAG